MGVYVHAFPEVITSGDPGAWLAGSRVHMTAQCRSVAVAYDSARFMAVPVGMPGATYMFQNSTIWYSNQAQVRMRIRANALQRTVSMHVHDAPG